MYVCKSVVYRRLVIPLSGCHYLVFTWPDSVDIPRPLSDFGVPCGISAVLRGPDGAVYFFRGERYWERSRNITSDGGSLMNWAADTLHCEP